MGGRGVSSTRIIAKNPEIKTKVENGFTVFKEFKINGVGAKIVKTINEDEFKSPYENMTPNTIYFAIERTGKIKTMTYTDDNGDRKTRIDVIGKKHKVNGVAIIPHAQDGKEETKKARDLTDREKEDLQRGEEEWAKIKK